jgi:hypothetical protein
LAVLVLASLAPAGAAAEGGTNTFAGACAGLDGATSWPEKPLRAVPTVTAMDAVFDGGTCTGTLDGRRVEDAPIAVIGHLRGVQSCGGGVQSGRVEIVIARRRFFGDLAYRRAGGVAVLEADGDAGGSAVIVARALVGAISDRDPRAQDPLLAPLAGPLTLEEIGTGCASTGLRRVPARIEQLRTTSMLASPRHR